MPVELEALTTSYEFEDRAAFFIEEVEKVARRYTSCHIEVENLTFERATDLEQRIKQLEASGKDKLLLSKLREMEYSFDVQSANENRVIILFYSHTSRPITNFELRADELARAFRGTKLEEESNTFDFEDDDSEEDTYRFVTSLIYQFKNDFKKYGRCQK